MKHDIPNPFHDGERAAQARAGVGDVAQWAGGFIRDYLPEQHREFHSSLPFLVFAGEDEDGHVWATILDGEDGFIRSPDPKHLTLDTQVSPDDPLQDRFANGGDIGGLGIELDTRRRNRFSGHVTAGSNRLTLQMRQTFGNCPQYIHSRSLRRVAHMNPGSVVQSDDLSADQIARIAKADTLFLGSGHRGPDGSPANGFDASHRGGAPGFVQVASPKRLLIPDYAGNNFFNTIGNLISDPRIGLLFVDFESGGLLHLSGRAKINWSPSSEHDPDARRLIDVEIDKVVDRPGALSLRWDVMNDRARKLQLLRREGESENITSFYLAPADGRPLAPFKPGQHLPIAVQIPGQSGMTERTYSLSGAAHELTHYRLSVKREEKGLMSRFLHDQFQPGDVIEAHPPAGDFTLPGGHGPVVLVSAGVGLTPMIPMLHALADSDRPAWYIHAARNGREHAMSEEVNEILKKNDRLQKCVFFSQPDRQDRHGTDYDVKGRLTAEEIVRRQSGQKTQFMLCGPTAFLSDLRTGLEAHGIPPENIHVETFGSR